MSAPEPQREGWAVPARAPLIAMLCVFAALLLALTMGAGLYRHRMAPSTRAEVHAFPSPQLERARDIPGRQREDPQERPPPDIDSAMAATLAQGNSLWEGEKR